MGNSMHVQHLGLDAEGHNERGNDHYRHKEHNKALGHYKRSLKIHKKTHGKKHPEVAKAYNNIATVYYNKGKYSKAVHYYHKSINIKLELFGGAHPDLALTYNNLGTVYFCMNRFEDALDYHARALQIEIDRLRQGQTATTTETIFIEGTATNSTSSTNSSGGCPNKEEGGENFTSSRKNLALAYGNMGADFSSQGDYYNALEYQEKCLGILKVELGEKHICTRQAQRNIKKIISKMSEQQGEQKDGSQVSYQC